MTTKQGNKLLLQKKSLKSVCVRRRIKKTFRVKAMVRKRVSEVTKTIKKFALKNELFEVLHLDLFDH